MICGEAHSFCGAARTAVRAALRILHRAKFLIGYYQHHDDEHLGSAGAATTRELLAP